MNQRIIIATLALVVVALIGYFAFVAIENNGTTITNMPTGSTLQTPEPTCFVGGCSGELCLAEPGAVSTCIYKEEYACYKTAKCERQQDGQCGWTQTVELTSCLMGK